MEMERTELKNYAARGVSDRSTFIKKTYNHLAGAILFFILVEYALFQMNVPEKILELLSRSQYSWIAFLGIFIFTGWFARSMAYSVKSRQIQYFGFGFYVIAEALIFSPMLLIAVKYSAPEVLPMATILTGMLFLGISFIAFTSKKDFSFLSSILKIGGFVLLGIIICSVLFGFTLGLGFSAIMIIFASCAILYDTSNIIHRYDNEQYVSASLELFASVALLFWYILRFLMQFTSSRD